MGRHVRPELPVIYDSRLADRRKCLKAQMLKERQKLESLIIEQYEKGIHNLGLDIGVLNQSRVLDKLLLDIMMLENTDSQ